MKSAYEAYRSFGVPTYAEPEKTPAGEMGHFYDQEPSLQLLDVGMFAHSDKENADVIPWTVCSAIIRFSDYSVDPNLDATRGMIEQC